jgi:hypothetical protein
MNLQEGIHFKWVTLSNGTRIRALREGYEECDGFPALVEGHYTYDFEDISDQDTTQQWAACLVRGE